jgi:hypothetical protein
MAILLTHPCHFNAKDFATSIGDPKWKVSGMHCQFVEGGTRGEANTWDLQNWIVFRILLSGKNKMLWRSTFWFDVFIWANVHA